MQSDWAAQVLHYWFEELRPAAWFRKDERVDAVIGERFGALYEQLAQIRPEQLTTPPCSSWSCSQAPTDRSQGQRSSSVSGMPAAILATFPGEWSASPSM